MSDNYQLEYNIPKPRREHKVRESKVDLPHFHGKDDMETYLDWEMKVEQFFSYHIVRKERKVSLVTLSFQGYAIKRHISSYYGRKLMDKLQRLHQKKISVEEYKQKMELYMLRESIREDKRTTISRFLSGLIIKIRDKGELLPYRDLNDLVQMCIKV
uniref:Retrotransposon gag domain-containing protein n=1 Tax=Cajanus cajan TaxID=3821 RepID=A0A151SYJ3_CAJCA|nr:hypothetical protein KK1_015304 [Cajanus cajan]